MKKNNFLIGLMGLLLSFFTFQSFAQSKAKLSIGDPAPAIKFSKWLKGSKFETFDPNQLYVMEFWATWCGPCKQAMPHMTELQKQYKGKVTFVGVNVWERIPKDQSYTTAVPAVEKFVKGNDANMGYTVIVDDKDQFMGNNWLRAAGQNGIPASFIVKNKEIIWIGHPGQLDAVIPKVLDNTFDVKSFKEESDNAAERARAADEARMAIFNPIQEAIMAKDPQKAIRLMDEVVAKDSSYITMMSLMKFKVLLTDVDEKQAIAFAPQFQQIYKTAPSLILGEVYKAENLSKETYLWAADNFGSTSEVTNPLIFDALATCYAKAGYYKKASDNQTKALELAEKVLKEGAMVGTIMDYTVEEYRKKLSEYNGKIGERN
ncbi:TlpA disulfide reductase family protein [Sphingobacterium sp.]|uniref:TlpA disulfide reductase family protein n=1 Tax=Sphingobacterium sp. TaxID=341027 RepID=UPI002898E290|nr:TlpA disulfide reductase family protein [Sphingobacterium sp.]